MERPGKVGHVFQDALSSLNPTITVGRHFTETRTGPEAGRRALSEMGLGSELFDAYPFELSDGQAQRIALAMATVRNPALLIADEVTTALAPETQEEF